MRSPTTRDPEVGRLGLTGRILAIALWAGLATGLIEALRLWVDQAVRGRVIFTSDYGLWMTPLLYAFVFTALGLGLAGVAALFYPRIRERVAVFIFVALGVLCLFIPITQIARWAAAIIALGVGAQAARLTSSHRERSRRVAGVALGALTALALVLYVGGRASRGGPSSGELVRPDLPNILLIVWDTVRSENLSLYGYEEPTTPVLEDLAARSAVFERAVAPSPWTLPTHASMFTGRWPHELSTSWYHALDDEEPTIAEVFAEHGYATGGFIANHHYTSYDSGLDRGFQAYADYRISWRQFLRSSWLTQTPIIAGLIGARSLSDAWEAVRAMNFHVGVKRANDRKHAAEVNEEFLAWLDGVGDRPFFAFLNHFDAHRGYWSPPGTRERFDTPDPVMRSYDAAIWYLDAELGQLLEALRERGKLGNTIVVVTSDHGELFGENGLYGHAHNLYYRTLHVPLLIWSPDRFVSPVRIEEEVSLRDLAVTLLDVAGIEDGASIPGSSLVRAWEGEAPTAPLFAEVEEGRNNAPNEPISRGPVRSALNDGWHYILNGDGVEELYDYLADPREENDLSSHPDAQARLARLRASLRSFGEAPAVVLSAPNSP